MRACICCFAFQTKANGSRSGELPSSPLSSNSCSRHTSSPRLFESRGGSSSRASPTLSSMSSTHHSSRKSARSHAASTRRRGSNGLFDNYSNGSLQFAGVTGDDDADSVTLQDSDLDSDETEWVDVPMPTNTGSNYVPRRRRISVIPGGNDDEWDELAKPEANCNSNRNSTALDGLQLFVAESKAGSAINLAAASSPLVMRLNQQIDELRSEVVALTQTNNGLQTSLQLKTAEHKQELMTQQEEAQADLEGMEAELKHFEAEASSSRQQLARIEKFWVQTCFLSFVSAVICLLFVHVITHKHAHVCPSVFVRVCMLHLLHLQRKT